MGAENFTSVREFILLGLTSHRRTQLLLFGIFLIIYLLTVLGNLLIIVLVWADLQLHTPMYYFLSQLAGVDICYVTSTLPQILVHLLTGKRAITLALCMVQINVAIAMGGTECLLLGVMAYDRYLAICHPLLYAVAMGKGCQVQLALACWITAPLLCTFCVMCLVYQTYCSTNQINHFMCELPLVLKLSCADTHIVQAFFFSVSAFLILVPLSMILTSYGFILYSVTCMRSALGWRKAFSTCGSHLLVVTMFYGTVFSMYMIPRSKSAPDRDKQIAVLYVVITPLLNPVIYTLRNKDIHRAAIKMLQRRGLEQ